MSLFSKSKSITLKFLNFILVLGIIACSIALGYLLLNMILPTNYVRNNYSPYPVYSKNSYLYADDLTKSESYSSTDSPYETDSILTESKPMAIYSVVLLCLIGALFVCNKTRWFDVAKPSGLKALTAISTVVIIILITCIVTIVVYRGFDDNNIKTLIFMLLTIFIYALAPFVSNLLRVFSAHNGKWLDYLNTVLVIGLCGALTSFTNTLLFIKSYDCGTRYYCDKNALPRTLIAEVILIIIFAVILFVVKKSCDKRHSDEIIKQLSDYRPTSENTQLQNDGIPQTEIRDDNMLIVEMQDSDVPITEMQDDDMPVAEMQDTTSEDVFSNDNVENDLDYTAIDEQANGGSENTPTD